MEVVAVSSHCRYDDVVASGVDKHFVDFILLEGKFDVYFRVIQKAEPSGISLRFQRTKILPVEASTITFPASDIYPHSLYQTPYCMQNQGFGSFSFSTLSS